jgi:1,4-dihydroxy-2-naphthoate octaprenyltransferase
MSESTPRSWLVYFFRASHPLFLAGGILLYVLGAGIARYLGNTLDWQVFLSGLTWVFFIQLAGLWLEAYYGEAMLNDLLAAGKQSWRGTMLFLAAASLSIVASLSVLLIRWALPSPAALAIMIVIALGTVFYSVPPVRLAISGYGELLVAILLANLVPALAFLLQAGELHRLVAMSTFPLTALLLASLLVYELPEYAADVRQQKRTLLVRIGWQNGMRLHNGLIIAAFLLIGLALTFGLPMPIALPVFIAFPLGILQLWQMRRITDGARPNWSALRITSITLVFLTNYLLVFGYWIR